MTMYCSNIVYILLGCLPNIVKILPKNCLYIMKTYYATENATFDANNAIKTNCNYKGPGVCYGEGAA